MRLLSINELPKLARISMNVLLGFVALWCVAMLAYWLLFGMLNEGPLAQIVLYAGYAAYGAWAMAIATRWGCSLIGTKASPPIVE